MVNYPHEVRFNAAPTEASRDANGHWIKPNPVADPKTLPCRCEPNDAGKITRSEDGQEVSYGFTVFLPWSTPDIPDGTPVEVYDGDRKVASGPVKGFFRNRFHVIFKL